MRKVKLIVHEKYAGTQNLSDVFAAVFLSDTAANGGSLGTGYCVGVGTVYLYSLKDSVMKEPAGYKITIGKGYGCEFHISQTYSGSFLRKRINLFRSVKEYGALRYAKSGGEMIYK